MLCAIQNDKSEIVDDLLNKHSFDIGGFVKKKNMLKYLFKKAVSKAY